MSGTRGISTRREDFAGRTETGDFYNPALLDGVQKVGNKAKLGSAYCNLGDAYYDLGDFENALQNHDEYLKNAVKVGDRAGEGRANGCLGKDYNSLGDFEQATDCHLKQLEIAEEMGDRAEQGRAYESLGNAYSNMDNFKTAILWFKLALYVAKEIGDKAEIGKANGNLGNSYFRDGAFDDALKHHRCHLRIAKEMEDKSAKGTAYGNLGHVYFCQGFFEKAMKFYKLSLYFAKEVEDGAEEGRASYWLGCTFESMGRLVEALDCFQSSLKQFDSIRSRGQSKDNWKINLQNEYKLVNIAIWRILVKQEKYDEALLAAEKARAQALIDVLKSKYRFETAHSGSDEEEDAVPDMISQLPSNAILMPIDNEDRKLSEHESGIGHFGLDKREDGARNILVDVPSTTVFLAIDKKEINIWVLKGNGVHFRKSEIGERYLDDDETLSFASLTQAAYPLPEDEILSMAATFAVEAKYIRRQRAEQMKKALRILYDVVISPVADLLEGDELIIVPDEYHSRKGVLLVGNPCLAEIVTNEPWNWNLPQAEEEVTAIGGILNSEPLIGEDATKEEVLRQLTSVTLVHIAAQGSDEVGEILLTPNPTRPSKIPELEDYMLSISDVMGIQLRARLVVLSCCHSAQGKIKAEGAVGIARAFLAAGARCVLVALWEIDDEATLEFMKGFYEQLVVGKRASVALNQAMKNLKESQKIGDVKDWAAFQLIGDDVALEFEEEE
ncbi:hypothetical protein ACROYT_G035912 [Oculina patagonica]